MQSLRLIRRRIRSVENTRKLTAAMEMVAASKLKRAQNQLLQSRPYFNNLENLKDRLLKSRLISHPLLDEKDKRLPVACLLFTSDTGLCGSYNADIIRYLEGFLKEYPKDSVRLIFIGKKGANFFARMGYSVLFTDAPGMTTLSKRLLGAFYENLCKEVWVCFTRYVSATSFKPALDKLLPIDSAYSGDTIDYILEPHLSGVLDRLLPEFVNCKIEQTYLESFTSEQSARMLAMRSATENAEQMIDTLTLVRNKVRQASITKELLEVVSTSEALK